MWCRKNMAKVAEGTTTGLEPVKAYKKQVFACISMPVHVYTDEIADCTRVTTQEVHQRQLMCSVLSQLHSDSS